MTPPGQTIGVAVSGGADSVVLLHCLARCCERLLLRLVVLHVNHQLRGEESEQDQSFVAQLAASLRLPVEIHRAPVESVGNLEERARLARRQFFRRCREEGLVDRVALGHNRSDQAETVLFRLLRGAGTAGLAGMRFVSDGWLIRPLLDETRSAIRAWGQSESLVWREDSSNQDRRFSRNRLRIDVFPMLTQSFNPNLEGILAGTSRIAQDEEAYWTGEIEEIFRELVRSTHFGSILNTGALLRLQPAVQRRLVRRALFEVRGHLRGIDLSHIESILVICASRHGHDRVMVPGADVLRSFDRLLFRSPADAELRERHYSQSISPGKTCHLPFYAGRIYVDPVTPNQENCVNFKEESKSEGESVDLDGDALALAGGLNLLYVRNWEPGDKIQCQGHHGPEKLKSLFQERRVALWERRHWPILTAGGVIVWAKQFGCDVRFSAVEGCRWKVRLTYWPSDESPAG
ncbi:MAG: tRNA lysidine(34) synthetase TilS [Bryobacteraceae bacterium]